MTIDSVNDDRIRDRVASLMPWALDSLCALARIPSEATEGFPVESLPVAHDEVIRLLRDAGASDVRDLRVEGKMAPVVVATVPGPAGAPTVLFYTHYDVVPAGDEAPWETPPFEPTLKDGAVYGRGTADSKASIVSIIGALRVFDGRPPVTMRIVIEGQEEFGSPFDFYPPTDPETFASDAMVIADVGSVRPGGPTLTTALRGSATLEIRTLAGDMHSGQYGGQPPTRRPAGILAGGGSIPLVMALDLAVPSAEKILFGATDGYAGIHGPNERVLLDELEPSMVAKAVFMRDFSGGPRDTTNPV